MSATLNTLSTTEALPVELADLPFRIGTNITKAAEGLDAGNLSKASVHLMYAMDSATFHFGYLHAVSTALRAFRAVVMRALMSRHGASVDIQAARMRCRRTLLDYSASLTAGTVAA